MTRFTTQITGHSMLVDIDNRFRVVIQRELTPANLIIDVHPITAGVVWDVPFETLIVDEGDIIAIETPSEETQS